MTMLTEQQIKSLNGKLNPDAVSKRKMYGTSGPELSYIEGWYAIEEANRIFGFDGWDSETVDVRLVHENYIPDGRGNVTVAYVAKCKITVGRCVREGTGYGSGVQKDPASAHESAIKEAETDARKRALMTFGNKFGLALYDKSQANVGYDEDQTPNPAFEPKKGGGVKDAKGYTDGKMNFAGKRATLKDIELDLLDVKTHLTLDNLYRAWSKTLDQWQAGGVDEENAWREIAMGLFTAKRKEINASTLEAG